MRLRRRAGTMEALQQLETHYENDPMKWRGKWKEWFGNDRPIYLELGIGKGRFLAGMSAKHPDVNWIGIDLREELLMISWSKVEETWQEVHQSGPENVALVLINGEMISELFEPGELARIYLNFSDPWPKKRHARRRLTHARFIQSYWKVLPEGGEIHFKTDSETLFEFSLNEFLATECDGRKFQLKNISLNLHRDGSPEWNVMTEYEKKFSKRGQPIFRLEAEKMRTSLQS